MIKEKVYEILEEVLGIDLEEVKITENSDIFDDLAAESIDLVDICFRLEKDFGLLKVNPGDIFPAFLQEEDSIDELGNISVVAIEKLKSEYPHSKKRLIDELTATKDLRTFLRVKNLIDFVEYRLGEN
jgi:acyl carrier protein